MDRRPSLGGRNGRPRRRPALGALEGLESRNLMAYSSAGVSLPDLVVSGSSGPVAAWGGSLGVTVNVQNLGASSMIEPLALAPGSVSSADAGPSTVGVYLTPHGRLGARSFKVGAIPIPPVAQNSVVSVTSVIPLPDRPAGFPGNGGKFYVNLVVDEGNAVAEVDEGANFARVQDPVLVTPDLPDVKVIGLDVPVVMQPGDTIQPNIRLANYGSAPTADQAPLVVRLVASLDLDFNAGDSTIAQYTIDNLLPQSDVPTTNYILGDANVDPGRNVTTLIGSNVTLPADPNVYYIGVVVDPDNQIRELSETGRVSNAHRRLADPRLVGVNNPGLPPAGVLTTRNTNLFPNAPIVIGSSGATAPFPTFPYPTVLDGSGVSVGFRARNAISTPTGTSAVAFGTIKAIDRTGKAPARETLIRNSDSGVTGLRVGLSRASRAKAALNTSANDSRQSRIESEA